MGFSGASIQSKTSQGVSILKLPFFYPLQYPLMKFKKVFALALLGVAALPALAATFEFDNLKWNGTTNTGFLPTDGVRCTGGDLCSSDVDHNVRNGDLTFVSGGLTVHATAFYHGNVAAVMQDHENGFNLSKHIGAGLGVYHLSHDSSDDNVTSGEKLVLTFDHAVELTSFGLRADGHNATDWINNGTFLFDGQEMKLPKGTGVVNALDVIAKSFTFEFGGRHPDQFYLSSLTVSAIPEPSTYALMAMGLGAVAFVARRRKQDR